MEVWQKLTCLAGWIIMGRLFFRFDDIFGEIILSPLRLLFLAILVPYLYLIQYILELTAVTSYCSPKSVREQSSKSTCCEDRWQISNHRALQRQNRPCPPNAAGDKHHESSTRQRLIYQRAISNDCVTVSIPNVVGEGRRAQGNSRIASTSWFFLFHRYAWKWRRLKVSPTSRPTRHFIL